MSEQLQPDDAKNPNILPQQMLAELLEGLTSDPHGSVMLMQRSLKIELDYRLGFPRNSASLGLESFRAARIQPAQYEAIRNYEEMLILFGRYGDYTPRNIGDWLKTPNSYLRNHALAIHSSKPPSPLKILEYDIHDGIDCDDFKRVVRAADVFLRTDLDAREALNNYLSH